MKKAKLLLTAIAVLTIVGGALALKAKSFESLYVTDGIHANDCNVKVVTYTMTILAPSLTFKCSTQSGTGNCTTCHGTTTEN